MELEQKAISLLRSLIETPSLSREENETAELIEGFLKEQGAITQRLGNNIWAKNMHFDELKPIVLLNSHHDTVKPNSGYTNDPFEALEMDGKLFGLGSNDAGGSLVALIATFLHFYPKPDLKYNLIIAATAEEEISGSGGIESLISHLPQIDFAIVGEPTQMNMAIAEKGLMVLDCVAHGQAGHAARNEGVNAIYKALKAIEWFRNFQFPEESESLGPVKMSVTVIGGGEQHNVVPDECRFVVDVRTTDVYSNKETLEVIRSNVDCEVKPRSTRLNPSGINQEHAIVQAGKRLGVKTYGSPTLSDQALMPFPSVKIGPGDSARSHTADEFVYTNEIKEGIKLYIELLSNVILKEA